jgi:hypothetical protein
MRSISKTVLRTCAGLATAAALVVGGAGVASAATTSPATHTSSHYGFGCNPYAREQWNLNGYNKVEAIYQGNTFTYPVTFKQYGGCLSGWLSDPGYPTSGPIYGSVYGNHVVFSFRYPSGSIQGTRTFNGYVNRWGYLSGYWYETGSENGSGSFSLAYHVQRACPWWYGFYRSCYVF